MRSAAQNGVSQSFRREFIDPPPPWLLAVLGLQCYGFDTLLLRVLRPLLLSFTIFFFSFPPVLEIYLIESGLHALRSGLSPAGFRSHDFFDMAFFFLGSKLWHGQLSRIALLCSHFYHFYYKFLIDVLLGWYGGVDRVTACDSSSRSQLMLLLDDPFLPCSCCLAGVPNFASRLLDCTAHPNSVSASVPHFFHPLSLCSRDDDFR